MALTSPALTLAIPAMFGNIKPTLDTVRRLGPTDFGADAPTVNVKPGATIKVPISTIAAASAYNDSTNNYETGGNTNWASLTCAHYLQGFDISGVNIDQGCDRARMEQLFTRRAGSGIAYAIQGAVKTALDAVTASTAVEIPAVASATLADYMGLAGQLTSIDARLCSLTVNGAEYAKIKSVCAAANIAGSDRDLAYMLGFKDVLLVPGMTSRAVIVPDGSFGVLARVPEIIADYPEYGTETDEDTGFSVGIVVASVGATNKRVVNADVWFGSYVISANAGLTTVGAVNVGTAS